MGYDNVEFAGMSIPQARVFEYKLKYIWSVTDESRRVNRVQRALRHTRKRIRNNFVELLMERNRLVYAKY